MSKLVEREAAPGSTSLGATPALAVQFFLIPLAVVGMVVLVYGGFRMMLTDKRAPEEYLSDVRSGGRERRWPAAYELSRLLANPETEVAHPELGNALVQAFEDSKGDDPQVRRYLALAIGRLRNPPSRAGSVLADSLDDPEAETTINVLWALAALGDPAVKGDIEARYASADPGVRKMVVYALGALGGEADDGRALVLEQALEDVVPDVQWNAAVSLAMLGRNDGEVVLARMLNREYVERNVTRTPALDATLDPASEVMVSGLQAVGVLGSPNLRDEVEALSHDDESLKVREVAMRTLEAIGPGTTPSPVAHQ
jgi:HEAT repeat protein